MLAAPFEISDVAQPTRAFVEIFLVAILAGQESVGEAVERENAEAVLERDVAQLAFELPALDHIVPGLQAAWLLQAVRRRRLHRFPQPRRGELRQTNFA